MPAMSARNTIRTLFAMAAAGLLFGPASATATETICTYVSTSAEHPVPLDERESIRQIQAWLLPEHIARGDEFAAAGQPRQAAVAYFRVFGSMQDRGVYYGTERCLSKEFYQRVADKLKVVASQTAAELIGQGIYDDRSRSGDQPSALRLLLMSNQYDEFIEHGFEYAADELLEMEVGLPSMAQIRLREIEQTQNQGDAYRMANYENDLTPLLDEELAAFDKLANFEEKLRAHLAPLYPKITDHWLAEEAKNFDDAMKTDGMFPKGQMLGRATDALKNGIDRLRGHPEELVRLRARANAHGKVLMAQKQYEGNVLMTQMQYQAAEDYFEIAENNEAAAKAGQLVEAQADTAIKNIEVSVNEAVEKMQKTDEEKAAFEDDTDEMAAEFGFDLEE